MNHEAPPDAEQTHLPPEAIETGVGILAVAGAFVAVAAEAPEQYLPMAAFGAFAAGGFLLGRIRRALRHRKQ